MLITRRSPIDEKIRTIDIKVTAEQMLNWMNGMVIQKAMPNISAEERIFVTTGITSEQVITGITSDQWEEIFDDAGQD